MTDRERLIEILSKQIYPKVGVDPAEVVADYLLDNGVIVPPCKVGDKVFVVSQGQGFCMCWNVYEGKVVDIHLNCHNKLTIRVENGEKFFGYYEPCFVFLTREEAETALAERSTNNGRSKKSKKNNPD